MGIDPTLITNAMANWQQPADPLAAYAKLQALKNGVVQQQIQQQQLQSGALDLQEKQQAAQDQQALSDVFKSAYAPDPTTGKLTLNEPALYSNMAARGLGSHIPTVQKSINDANKNALELQKAQTDANVAAQDYLAQQLLYVKDAKYDPATFTSTLASAVNHGALPAAEAAQINQRFQQNPTPEGVQALVDPLLSASDKAQGILAKRATAGKDIAEGEAATKRETRENQAQLEKEADAADQALAGATPDNFAALRDAALIARTKAGRSPSALPTTPAGVTAFNASLMKPEERVTTAATAARDAAMQKDRDANLAIARGRLGVEQARLKAETAVQGPFMGLPPQERGKAEAAYDKDTKDYTDKISTARGLQDTIALAQAGNKAAPALVPIEELRGFLNRINATELASVGKNAGSIKDQLQGYIDGKLKGQPIPPALLNDMLDLSKAQETVAKRAYLGRLAANKAAFGASPPPIDIESVYAGGSAPAQPAAQPAAAPAPVPGGALGQPPPVAQPAAQPARPAAVPDWKKAAAAAPIGSKITLPGGKVVLKTGANSFQPVQ